MNIRVRVNSVVGFLVIIAALLGGIIASIRYILEETERRHGALALAIAIILAACLWQWINRDRRDAQNES